MIMELGLIHILPEDHILLPDHKWGNPVGDWPKGTPSLPLYNISTVTMYNGAKMY